MSDPISRLREIAKTADPLGLVTIEAGDLKAIVVEHRCLEAGYKPGPTTVSDADLYGDMHREPSSSDEVERAKQAMLADLRDRRFLKYLFAEQPEHCGAYGYVESPLDLEVQDEIVTALANCSLQALRVEPPYEPDGSDAPIRDSVEPPSDVAAQVAELRAYAPHGDYNGKPLIPKIALDAADKLEQQARQIAERDEVLRYALSVIVAIAPDCPLRTEARTKLSALIGNESRADQPASPEK
jgi:hypothetical protein